MRASGVQQTHIPSELTSLGDAISFGPFLLFRTERLLEESGVPVHVGSRAMDILTRADGACPGPIWWLKKPICGVRLAQPRPEAEAGWVLLCGTNSLRGPSSLCVQGCPVAQLRCLWRTGPGGFSTPAGATCLPSVCERVLSPKMGGS
jgi:hypothetical protein